MRHRKKLSLLGRPADQRKALLRGLTTDVINHGQILTTEAKAKAVRRQVDKMITLGKRGDLHARRQAASYLYGDRRGKIVSFDVKEEFDHDSYVELERTDKKVKAYEKTAVQKLFGDLSVKYADRNGGYTRIIKAPPRRGDAAPMAIIQLV